MAGFAYANARLRALRSRFFTPKGLQALAGERDVSSLLGALTQSAYREAVESALVGHTGLAALMVALQRDLSRRLSRIPTFFTGPASQLVSLVLGRYDVANLKAVLRGVSQQAAPEQIAATIVPAGSLAVAEWGELSRASSASTVVDLLATWQLPIAQPLLAQRVEFPGSSLLQQEMALERWYGARVLAARGASGWALREYARHAADITNALTLLRLFGGPERRVLLEQHGGAAGLLVHPGRIPHTTLLRAAEAESLPAAVNLLATTVWGGEFQAALERFRATGLLSSFERELSRSLLKLANSFFVRDPLGIGVLLGYLTLSENEAANLRRIGHGLYLGQPAEEIRADLLQVGA